MLSVRSKLITAVAVGAATVGGAAIAGAATSGSASSTGQSGASTTSGAPAAHDPSQGGHTVNGRTETLLTGDTASKVRAAALAKVSGTVERVETNVDSSAPYEAHIRKADGSEVEVQVSRDFTVAAVNDMGGMGRHP
jgi:ABC-type transport system substrate-binding protein